MLKEREKFLREVTFIIDLAVTSISFLLAFYIRKNFHAFYRFNLIQEGMVIPEFSVSIFDYLPVMYVAVVLWSVMLSFNGMYKSMRTKPLPEIAWIIIKSAVGTLIAFSVLVFFFKFKFVSRLFFLFFMLLCSCLLILEKLSFYYFIRQVRKQGYNYRRIIIVGTGMRVKDFIKKITAHSEWGFKILGIIDDEGKKAGEEIEGIKVLSGMEGLPRYVQVLSADEVVFMVPRLRLNSIESAVIACETIGVKTTIALDLFDFSIARFRQTELDGVPFITYESAPSQEWWLFIKRVIDVVFSGLGLIIFSPLLLLTAVLVKTTSRGPVFFRQKRVGLNGRKFVMYKFRTMYCWARKKQLALAGKNVMSGPVFKVKDDPRVTGAGRFLRKFSIDELPQLFNVFVGHMSIVGPRPPLQREVSKYESWQRRRLSMRPGVTCLWQISGRNRIIDFNDWMKLDLQYIDNWSLKSDFIIFLKTIPVVLFGKGAY
ncbi:MAG: sugar transferase [Candidatus Omnitrophota bacterium]